MRPLLINLFRWSLLPLLLALPLGCSSNQPTATTSPSPAAPSPTPSPITSSVTPSPTAQSTPAQSPSAPTKNYAKGESFEYKGATLTVNQTREFQGETTFEKPPEGKKWLAVELSANNQGERDLIITFTQIKVMDDKGKTYDQSLLALSVLDTDFETVKPGKQGKGDFAFEVPADATITKVIWDPSNGACAEKSILADIYPCEKIPYIISLK